MSASGSWVEVDRGALSRNIAIIRKQVGRRLVLVLVKADGYGHGAVETARTVLEAGADRVGVARLHEGGQLRRSGVEGPIHVLEPFHPDDLAEYGRLGLVATVCDPDAAQALSDHGTAGGTPLTAHLKVDTGMARLGLHHQRDLDRIRSILSLPGVHWEGIFTHFARSDDDPVATELQLERFLGLLAALEASGVRPPIAHAANSAAIFRHPESFLDMVRPGIAVYGYPPPGAEDAGLEPVLRLRSTVRHLSWKEPGEAVSYGATWVASRRTRLAVLPLGYGDGFWRGHSNRFSVEINGTMCPQVGRICMDLMMVDVTDAPSVEIGDAAWIIGSRPELSAERLARNLDTIVYEVLCDLGRRLERVFV
ncbi:MAG TPA: alanine racemase [Fibrobacteria bacterium]|nr:alanine racemase [Fibrobacteria bacterium]